MSKSAGSKKAGDGRPSDNLDAGSVANKNVEKVTGTPGEGVESKIIGKEPPPEETQSRAISMERWQQAQAAERALHTLNYMEGLLHYGESYKNYFNYVGLGNDLGGLHVIEVGPADFPALNECRGDGRLFVVEPMPSEILERICKEKGIELIRRAFEYLDFSTGKPEGTIEVWLFNVMQHIIDPDKFIEQAKTIADRIRFFEPVDQPVTEYHPHAYTLTDYQNYFGDCVNLYAGGTKPGFHEADCAYGVWIK